VRRWVHSSLMGSGIRSQMAPHGKSPHWRTGWRHRRAQLQDQSGVGGVDSGGHVLTVPRVLLPKAQGQSQPTALSGQGYKPAHQLITRVSSACHQPPSLAKVCRTLSHTPLAVLARVAIWAGAVVLIRLSIDAGPPIDTGVVAATVVQVWGRGRSIGVRPHHPHLPSLRYAPTHHPPAPPNYLCHRAGRPSWSHSHNARAPHSCRVHSRGMGHTRHRTCPASRNYTWGAKGRGCELSS
jgi:hypothetical protein